MDIQFRMLGNDLGNLFLPDAILFVEGETDKIYLQRLLEINFPHRKIVVESCGGDIAARLNSWSSTMGDLQTGPYRNRSFVVADSVMQSGLERVIARLGIPDRSVIKWKDNGIEFLYPLDCLSLVFGATVADHSALTIVGDRVCAHGITKTKMELARAVERCVTESTILPEEISTKLLLPLRSTIEPDQ